MVLMIITRNIIYCRETPVNNFFLTVGESKLFAGLSMLCLSTSLASPSMRSVASTIGLNQKRRASQDYIFETKR